MIPRAGHWNQKTREESIKQAPHVDGCPAEALKRQAALYREVMEAVIANGKDVDRVTVWGISDRHNWLNKWPWQRVNHGHLFDREAKPKPAFHAVAGALGQE